MAAVSTVLAVTCGTVDVEPSAVIILYIPVDIQLGECHGPRIVMGGLGRLGCLALSRCAGWSASRWAATSNVEVGQTTHPVNGVSVKREWKAGSEA